MADDNNNFQEMMASFMKNAKKMQEDLQQAYEQMAQKNKDITVTAKAGGDLVTAEVNLKMQLTNLILKPELYNEKPEVISELIIAAVNQGITIAQERVKGEMLNLSKQMGLPGNLPFPPKEGE
jgi:nucleoid-associated protein EbfC